MVKKILFVFLIILFSSAAFADKNKCTGILKIKELEEQDLLIVEYDGKGDIAPYFGKLVAYYNKESISFNVIFPQMNIEFSRNKQWIAIAFEGEAKENKDVRIKKLPKATVASMVHIGSYQSLWKTVRKIYQELQKVKYFPDSSQPLRFLYWNSPDDNHPKDLITEVQIPVRLR